MTAIWGPMGWMTLHSISLLYPNDPSPSDKQVLQSFLDDFANSITCPHCERHFKTIFENYRKLHPEWSSSKFQLFLFVARAHNTVNKRLEKPLKTTVQECLDAFMTLSRVEGIVPALESSHAVAWALREAPKMDKNIKIVVNLSGRGDKDADYVADKLGL